MRNVILIAPPAAGKGTVSQVLREKYGFAHISAGDVLRDEIKSKSKIGKSIKKIVKKGKLVDDDMLKVLIKNRLSTLDDNQSYVLDGYPRKINQAKHYEEMVNELGTKQAIPYFLELDEETAMHRTLDRLICSKCKISYNSSIKDHQPKVEGRCDVCNGKLEQRNDDNEESFKNRFENYMNETEPLINYYKEKNNLVILDASKTTEEIVNEIILTLGD